MQSAALFVIVAFCLGGVLILYKNSIPPNLKKWLAIWSIALIIVAFAIIIYSLFTLGA